MIVVEIAVAAFAAVVVVVSAVEVVAVASSVGVADSHPSDLLKSKGN